MTVFSGLFRTARTEGLGVTLHIAEVRTLSGPKEPSKKGFNFCFIGDGADKGKFDGRGDEGTAQL
jgi:hypothetical protein